MIEFDHRSLDAAAPRQDAWSVARDMDAIFAKFPRHAAGRDARAGPLPAEAPKARGGRLRLVLILIAVGLVGLAAALRVDLDSPRWRGAGAVPPPPARSAEAQPVTSRSAAPPPATPVPAMPVPAMHQPAARPAPAALVAIAPTPDRAAVMPRPAQARSPAAPARRARWHTPARVEMVDASHRAICPGSSRSCLQAMEDDADRELRAAYLGAIDAGAPREDLVAFRANWEGVRREEAHHPRALIARYRTMSRQLRLLVGEARAARY